jgi:hypothetical protein
MRMHGLILAGFVLLATGAWAQGFWEQRPYTEWEADEVVRFLTSSPWAKEQKFSSPSTMGGSGGGRGRGRGGGSETGARAPDPEIVYTVRWHSALPVRMAWARFFLLRDPTAKEAAQEVLENETFDQFYVISVGWPARQAAGKFDAATLADVQKNSYLVKRNRDRLVPGAYLPPSEAGGVAMFLFPRHGEDGRPWIRAEEREVDFVTGLGDRRINQRFRLADMLFRGKLEL